MFSFSVRSVSLTPFLLLVALGMSLPLWGCGDDGGNNSNASSNANNASTSPSNTPLEVEASIKASNVEAGDKFGNAVAIDGTTMVVGAVDEDSLSKMVGGDQSLNDGKDVGAAYVFELQNGAWVQTAYLKASNAGNDPDPMTGIMTAGDSFGYSVAISGDTIVVGAPGEDSLSASDEANNEGLNPGAAYVFKRQGGSWSQVAYLKPTSIEGGDLFGERVAISGGVIVVSTPYEDSSATGVNGDAASNDAEESGAAYVFEEVSGTWNQTAYLKPSNTTRRIFFGDSVAVSGQVIAVGAPREEEGGVNQSGAVYLFEKSGDTWSETAFLKAPIPEAQALFGQGVALDQTRLLVGAPGATRDAKEKVSDFQPESGSAYLYEKQGDSWELVQLIDPEYATGGSKYGQIVALDGDVIAVGAPEDKAGGIPEELGYERRSPGGIVRVFKRGGSGWSQVSMIQSPGKAEDIGSERFGEALGLTEGRLAVGTPLNNTPGQGVSTEAYAGSGALNSGVVNLYEVK